MRWDSPANQEGSDESQDDCRCRSSGRADDGAVGARFCGRDQGPPGPVDPGGDRQGRPGRQGQAEAGDLSRERSDRDERHRAAGLGQVEHDDRATRHARAGLRRRIRSRRRDAGNLRCQHRRTVQREVDRPGHRDQRPRGQGLRWRGDLLLRCRRPEGPRRDRGRQPGVRHRGLQFVERSLRAERGRAQW